MPTYNEANITRIFRTRRSNTPIHIDAEGSAFYQGGISGTWHWFNNYDSDGIARALQERRWIEDVVAPIQTPPPPTYIEANITRRFHHASSDERHALDNQGNWFDSIRGGAWTHSRYWTLSQVEGEFLTRGLWIEDPVTVPRDPDTYYPELAVRFFQETGRPATDRPYCIVDSRGFAFSYDRRWIRDWSGQTHPDFGVANCDSGRWFEVFNPDIRFHNPAGLTPAQVGVSEGWRLLTPAEITEENSTTVEYWDGHRWCGDGISWTLYAADNFRTRTPLPNQAPPAAIPPSEFPAPPEGDAWHNPARLTPAQVGVAEGWRLVLASESHGTDERVPSTQYWSRHDSRWAAEEESRGYYADERSSLRTRQPLPAVVPGVNWRQVTRKLGTSIANILRVQPSHALLPLWMRNRGLPPLPDEIERTAEAIGAWVLSADPPGVPAPTPAPLTATVTTRPARNLFSVTVYREEDQVRTVRARYRGSEEVNITEADLRRIFDNLGYSTQGDIDWDEVTAAVRQRAEDRASVDCDEHIREIESEYQDSDFIDGGVSDDDDDIQTWVEDHLDDLLPATAELEEV
jgi:hypothetical protein